jgi:thioredoxin 1
MSSDPALVVVLCAGWCRVCQAFEPVFASLAAEWPDARFVWLDVDDGADALGEVEVDDFPTLAVYRDGRAIHFGAVLPQAAVVRRVLGSLLTEDRAPIDARAAIHSLPARLAA